MLCNFPCRIVLIVVNTLTGLAGIAIMIVGSLMVWGQDLVAKLLNQFLTPLLGHIGSTQDASQVTQLIARILTSTSPIGLTLFSIGAALTILSFIGYCGACCNYKILLYVYAAIVGAMALAVLIAVIVYFAGRDKLGDYVLTQFGQSVKKYHSMAANTVDSLVVGLIQPKLKCCGVDSWNEFTNMSLTDIYDGQQFANLKVPIPCCKMNDRYVLVDKTCPENPTALNSYMYTPCRETLKSTFLHYMNYAAYGLVGVFVVLLVLMLFTILTICIDVI